MFVSETPPPSLSIVVTDLESAARVVLPWAEKRGHRLVKVGDERVDALHGDSIIEGHASAVIVQEDAHARRVPVVGHGDAEIGRAHV